MLEIFFRISLIDPLGIPQGSRTREYRGDLPVEGIFQKTREINPCIEFIVGTCGIPEFWKIGFLTWLGAKHIIYQGGNRLGIETNPGIDAELNKFHRFGGSKVGTF